MTQTADYVYDDYVHSSNALFHFMKRQQYLIDAIERRALCPRYCIEDIEYLDISHCEYDFKKVAVLQKCFCDIPLHSILNKFPVRLAHDDDLADGKGERIPPELSHTDFYGEYALAFSKRWGEDRKLQLVHYLSEKADYASKFSLLMGNALSKEDIPDEIADALINMLCFLKPLRGTMSHSVKGADTDTEHEVYKNFHDEHEWRYVPSGACVNGREISPLIANDAIENGLLPALSNRMERDDYRSCWLPFELEEIRYIIVPDNSARLEIIKAIRRLQDRLCTDNVAKMQEDILISKIIVLDDIRKDF